MNIKNVNWGLIATIIISIIAWSIVIELAGRAL